MELEAMAGELVDRHDVPGAAVGFVDGHGAARIVTVGACGDGPGPVDDDSVFAAASLSKPAFSGAAVSSEVVRHLFRGGHPALDVWHRPSWIDSWA